MRQTCLHTSGIRRDLSRLRELHGVMTIAPQDSALLVTINRSELNAEFRARMRIRILFMPQFLLQDWKGSERKSNLRQSSRETFIKRKISRVYHQLCGMQLRNWKGARSRLKR